MASDTVSLGDGTGDTGTAYQLSTALNTKLMSDFTPGTAGTYISGGFDSLGNAYTSRPIMVYDVSVRVGGSYDGYTNNAQSLTPIMSSQSDGTPSYGSGGSVSPTSGTVTASSNSSFANRAFAGTKYYYGFNQGGSGTVIVFARGGSSGTIWRNGATAYSNSRISGSVSWSSIPSAPQSVSVNVASISPTSAQITWTAPADDGGSATSILGYRINYRKGSSGLWSVYGSGNTGTTATSIVLTDLDPSQYYEVQVAATSTVTDLHNSDYSVITAHVGERSSTVSFTTLADHQIKVWDGTEFRKAYIKVWDGAAFKTVANASVSVWTGSEFKNVKIT